MRSVLILLLFAQFAYAVEIIAVYEMPSSSGYHLVSPQALTVRAEKKADVPVFESTAGEELLTLSGTFKVGKDFVALINGDSYRLNTNVSGYKIINIDVSSATLLKKGKKVKIYVENN